MTFAGGNQNVMISIFISDGRGVLGTGLRKDRAQSAAACRPFQANADVIAKFYTDPMMAPATPAIHHSWLELKT